ncbi:MAG: putative VWA domain-containing protein [Streblomastix strix]|uniref:Putative VWA domain-containing protein n=1 Tax=Streblomastix strix TaxID=222440 RepID=A0A5J4WY39_9EUKA|nr:MAG: putative VWA domain-containing protein [Streblomastix strix]
MTVDYSVRVIESISSQVKIHALVTITAPKTVERSPVCMVLVIDKSGNMQLENKLPHAIEAGQVLVDQLEERDKLGIVEFDNIVTTRQKITPAKDKERLKRVLAGIEIGGSTNISDALIRAQQMLSEPSAQGIKRILLISDGQANEGIQGAEELGFIAGQKREQGITVSTIGVGLDYDEVTMQKIAHFGGGNFYHTRQALNLVGLLQAELNIAKELVSRRTEANYLRPVSVIGVKVYGYEITQERIQEGSLDAVSGYIEDIAIQMSDLSSGEIRQILIELAADPRTATQQEGPDPDSAKILQLGLMKLRFSRSDNGPKEEFIINFNILVDDNKVRRDAVNQAAAESIEKVRAEILSAESNDAHIHAMEELDDGEQESALSILQKQKENIDQYQQKIQTQEQTQQISSPQVLAIQQQKNRFEKSISQLSNTEPDAETRRDSHLQSIEESSHLSQGYYSSSNRAHRQATQINTQFHSQIPEIPSKPKPKVKKYIRRLTPPPKGPITYAYNHRRPRSPPSATDVAPTHDTHHPHRYASPEIYQDFLRKRYSQSPSLDNDKRKQSQSPDRDSDTDADTNIHIHIHTHHSNSPSPVPLVKQGYADLHRRVSRSPPPLNVTHQTKKVSTTPPVHPRDTNNINNPKEDDNKEDNVDKKDSEQK